MSGMEREVSDWRRIDPLAYGQGWDAAMAGKSRSVCDFMGGGPRVAWNAGYTDAQQAQNLEALAEKPTT
jgi:ribosome modulation factor